VFALIPSSQKQGIFMLLNRFPEFASLNRRGMMGESYHPTLYTAKARTTQIVQAAAQDRFTSPVPGPLRVAFSAEFSYGKTLHGCNYR